MYILGKFLFGERDGDDDEEEEETCHVRAISHRDATDIAHPMFVAFKTKNRFVLFVMVPGVGRILVAQQGVSRIGAPHVRVENVQQSLISRSGRMAR